MNRIQTVIKITSVVILVVSVVAMLGLAVIPGIILLPAVILTAITTGITFAIWRWGLDQVSDFLSSLGSMLQNEPLKGFSVATLLTGVYIIICWVLFGWIAGFLVEEIGVSHRLAWLIVAVMGALIAPAIWHLYAAAGIPGKPEDVKKAGRIIIVPILILFAWVYWETPAHLFDHKTGLPLFWVAEEEGKVYFYPTPTEEELEEIEENEDKELPTYYSKETGEKLRLGTAEDAKKYRKEILAVRIKEDLPSLKDSLRILAPTASAETVKVVPAQSSRSFEIIAPPAPRWSKPLDRIGRGISLSTKVNIDSTDGQVRYWTGDEKIGTATIGKPMFIPDWHGVKLQSMSGKEEVVTVWW